MYPPPQPIVRELSQPLPTVGVLHTAVCPRDRAVMWVSVSESQNYLGSDTVSRKTALDSRNSTSSFSGGDVRRGFETK